MKYGLVNIVLFYVVTGSFARSVKRQVLVDGDCRIPDFKRSIGKCTPIYSCVPMMNFLTSQKTIGRKTAALLREYRCRSDKPNEIIICCPFRAIKILENIMMELPTMDHSTHKNAHLLPKSTQNTCGNIRADNKIIQGNIAGLHEFPWAAAIKLKQGSRTSFGCGGSLINNRYVLTAAHCIRNAGNEIVGVRLGEHDFTTIIDCEYVDGIDSFCGLPHQDFSISLTDVIVHSGYNPKTLRDDIALIRLPSEAKISWTVSPICLPVTMEEKVNKVLSYTVIGWGKTSNKINSDILRKAEVLLMDNLNCSYLNPNGRELTERQLCAGSSNQYVCNGDSGGSLTAYYTNGRHIAAVQYGILSFGPSLCDRVDFPATYTRVASYMDWILNNLKP